MALLLTVWLFRGMHLKISVVRKKGMLWTPAARKRLGFLYEAYKTESASFELVSLIRRGATIGLTVMLRNFPVPAGAEQLLISLIYLYCVWKWRPFEWHEATIPRGCCGCGLKPWLVQDTFNARQPFAEHFFRSNALHCAATACTLIPAECALQDLEILSTVLQCLNQIFALSIAITGRELTAFMLIVLGFNCIFMIMLIIHLLVCLKKMGGITTLFHKEKDWSKENADSVVPRLTELIAESRLAEDTGRKGRARELRRQIEIEQALALSSQSRSGPSVRRIQKLGVRAFYNDDEDVDFERPSRLDNSRTSERGRMLWQSTRKRMGALHLLGALSTVGPLERVREGRGVGEGGSRRPPVSSDREALVQFFSRVAPQNVQNVDSVLSRFEHDVDGMYALLERLYPGEPIERPRAAVPPATGGGGNDDNWKAHEEALFRFFERVCPDKLQNVPAICERFRGDPDSLWQTLERMYPHEGVALERPTTFVSAPHQPPTSVQSAPAQGTTGTASNRSSKKGRKRNKLKANSSGGRKRRGRRKSQVDIDGNVIEKKKRGKRGRRHSVVGVVKKNRKKRGRRASVAGQPSQMRGKKKKGGSKRGTTVKFQRHGSIARLEKMMKAHKAREEKERSLQAVIKARGPLVAWAWRAKAAIAALTPEERRQRQQVKSQQHIERSKTPAHLRERRTSAVSPITPRAAKIRPLGGLLKKTQSFRRPSLIKRKATAQPAGLKKAQSFRRKRKRSKFSKEAAAAVSAELQKWHASQNAALVKRKATLKM